MEGIKERKRVKTIENEWAWLCLKNVTFPLSSLALITAAATTMVLLAMRDRMGILWKALDLHSSSAI